jgi:hypothetical protein
MVVTVFFFAFVEYQQDRPKRQDGHLFFLVCGLGSPHSCKPVQGTGQIADEDVKVVTLHSQLPLRKLILNWLSLLVNHAAIQTCSLCLRHD